MVQLTWFDNNSWLIELGGKRVLVDPWLVGSLVFGNAPWFFKGERSTLLPIPEEIDLILLSQGLDDHAHLPTLQHLNRSIPVAASPNGAKVVEGLGYERVTVLGHGDSISLGDSLEITAFPGAPIGPLLTENGYVLQDLTTGTSLYYEPHGYHSPQLQRFAPIDILIIPLLSLTLPVVGAFVRGQEVALDIIKQLQPQVVIPTTAGEHEPTTEYSGVLGSLVQVEGTMEKLRTALEELKLSSRIMPLIPGNAVSIDVQPRSVSLS
ncbi:MBL fold metallo-hydrolase [Spirulina subsalsa FACHB-351]|uniref:MBL fold metallo-hydrolase n=1 Tax=Spirulina subsalsa FACHB-351 TaxID=234711 RepID=A0ABT3L568_9CYAN|nr:MBL fold metallo-hydrolase [Spirulina subsalsa]MCW6036643.1 MBL fold metallo-hydrolase [Spirulina subsalsa FACHB-351]